MGTAAPSTGSGQALGFGLPTTVHVGRTFLSDKDFQADVFGSNVFSRTSTSCSRREQPHWPTHIKLSSKIRTAQRSLDLRAARHQQLRLFRHRPSIEQVRQINRIHRITNKRSHMENFLHGPQVRRMRVIQRTGIRNSVHVLVSA